MSLSEASAQFALNLLGEVGKGGGEEGNCFFSPVSISVALAMTFGGSDTNTAKEMKEVLFKGNCPFNQVFLPHRLLQPRSESLETWVVRRQSPICASLSSV